MSFVYDKFIPQLFSFLAFGLSLERHEILRASSFVFRFPCGLLFGLNGLLGEKKWYKNKGIQQVYEVHDHVIHECMMNWYTGPHSKYDRLS